MKSKYKIELDEEQLNVIQESLDFYSRIGMGQFNEMIGPKYSDFQERLRLNGDYVEAEVLIRQLKKKLTGLDHNQFYSIASPRSPRYCKIAWEIYQTFRYRISWDRNPSGGTTTNYNEPFKITDVALPKIEKS